MKPGINGVLITCNFRERQALMEAYDLLNEANDRLNSIQIDSNPDSTLSKDESNKIDVEDELQAELASLKAERAFQQVNTECKNTIFVKIVSSKWSSHALMNSIWNDIEQNRTAKCRHICKFIPIAEIVHSTENQILKGVERLLASEPDDEQTFKIEIKVRLHSGIKKDDLIKEIGVLVNKTKTKWKVNLNEPTRMLYIDVLHKHTALSVLKDFNKYRKYNLVEYAEKVIGPESTENSELSLKSEAEPIEQNQSQSSPLVESSAVCT